MNEPPQCDNTLTLGQSLPTKIAEAVSGSGTVINLPYKLIVVALTDYKSGDLTSFNGPARFRVGLAQNFLLISPKFRGLSFDIVWSPFIAKMAGEPEMDRPSASDQMMFNFVLVDGFHIVRGIRLATVSPDVTMALWQARSELLARAITAASIHSEIAEIFDQYPRGIPETFFHASCDFGTSWLSPVNSITLGGVLIILLTLPLFLIHFKKIASRRRAWHVQT